MKIRAAIAGDEPGIAAVHVESWRTTYKGIVPDDYLDNLKVEQRTALWEQNLLYPGVRVIVAVEDNEDNGRIVGFICGGPAPAAKKKEENQPHVTQLPDQNREQSNAEEELSEESAADSLYNAELSALYLLQQVQGRGIGRRLVKALFQSLANEGLDAVHVWVLEDNPAKTFYGHLGAARLETESIEIGGRALIEQGMVWSRQAFAKVLAETEDGIDHSEGRHDGV